jgi:putative transposase
MPNTYTQIHIHAVFVVKFRACVISAEWKNELYAYITGIVQNNKHKMLAINGMPDHVHIFFGYRPSQPLPDLLQDIKACSSKWINEKRFLKQKFAWQTGYGAFSYSKNDIHKVVRYIHDQEQHHQTKSFREEYIDLLNEHGIEYDEKYIFTDPE